MAREASVKVRLTQKEDIFLTMEAEKMEITRSEYIRRLIHAEIKKTNEK